MLIIPPTNTRIHSLPTRLRALAASILSIGTTLAAPGDLDTTFNITGRVTTDIGGTLYGGGYDAAGAVAVQRDGKIVVAGYSNDNGGLIITLTRYLPNGTFDTNFNGTGIVKTDFSPYNFGYGIALQSDGKILVAGTVFNEFGLTRYNTDGSADTSFNGTGMVITTDFVNGTSGGNSAYSVAMQSDGKIVAAGQYSDRYNNHGFAVARYQTNGTLDTSFNGTGKANSGLALLEELGRSVAIQSDGKIVVAGYGWDGIPGHSYDVIVRRYTTAGVRDSTFNGGLVATNLLGDDRGLSVALQSDGKILVGGETQGAGNKMFALLRYKTDGTLDTAFNGTGAVITPAGTGNASGQSVAVQRDGRILLAGYSIVGGSNDFSLVRYTTNGSLDTSFGSGGKVATNFGGDDVASGMAIQDDGKILLAGTSYVSNGDFAIARYEGGPFSPLESWRLQYFSRIANSGISANFADPESDGVPNIVEYAFGLNPTQSSSSQLPQAQPSGGNYIVSFTQPAGVSGITYGAEWSTMLAAGTWTAIADSGSALNHVFSVSIGGNSRVFLRLKVTAP